MKIYLNYCVFIFIYLSFRGPKNGLQCTGAIRNLGHVTIIVSYFSILNLVLNELILFFVFVLGFVFIS